MIYKLNCKLCGKEYTINCSEKQFNKGLYTKFCSRRCANTRNFSEETKRKISETLKKRNTNKQPKLCKICGGEKGKCLRPEICKHVILSWWNNFIPFGLDISKIGSKDIYYEYDKTKNLILTEYFDNNLSPAELYKKYNCEKYINHSENILHVIKSFDVGYRGCSEAVVNAFSTGILKMGPIKTQYKCGWHTTWNNKEVYLRSSYEFDYAKELDEQKIDYDVEGLRIKYWNNQKQEFRCAIPDFYLPETNTIVEIKSNYTFNEDEMVDKFNEYKKLGYNIKLVLEHEEKIINQHDL